MKLHRMLLSECMKRSGMYLRSTGHLRSKRLLNSGTGATQAVGARYAPEALRSPLESRRRAPARSATNEHLLRGGASLPGSIVRRVTTEAPLSIVPPPFVVMRFDQEGNVTSFEKKKTELCQELSLQARDLRFQHSTSLTTRNNCIILRMEVCSCEAGRTGSQEAQLPGLQGQSRRCGFGGVKVHFGCRWMSNTEIELVGENVPQKSHDDSSNSSLKAIVTPRCLLVLDFRGLGLERWLVLELAPQLASQAHSLPFEFRALEAILQHRVNNLQTRLNEVEPVILDVLESLVDPKILSADRSKLHVLLQNSKSLSELETDIKVFKDSLLKILDEDEIIEELCLTKWTDPRVFEESSLGIDHAEEMEHLLDNYYMQAEELGNEARELKGLIDDSESVIFINLDSHRNVMMRLNLQLTMGTFSLSLFGLIGVAFGMNLESSFEEDPRVFWLVTGFMFLGSGLIWRRLLSFLGRHLEPALLPPIPPVWKRNLKAGVR
ncbi:magnesium transporter MRS2 homolog, mitochondrial isoform X1 [Phycodurus eques]|uniref:magnesium transporter MRS2 homolog, mitochondrial isoform X1 n=1 Tax=Phycodurus eques TaxID=693459 RepID=UPI002ACDD6B1|nr:magnesium transporter MRS2 homolog, mitochondrial isoform X1 [Phycodurus eques]